MGKNAFQKASPSLSSISDSEEVSVLTAVSVNKFINYQSITILFMLIKEKNKTKKKELINIIIFSLQYYNYYNVNNNNIYIVYINLCGHKRVKK